MKTPDLALVALEARPALGRRGGFAIAAGALAALAAVAWLALLPRLAAQAGEERAALAQAEVRARAPRPAASAASEPSAEARLREFHGALGDVRKADDALQAIFAAGEQSRLELDKADYKLAYDKAGKFWTYAVQLPVTGSYASIRAFGERVLLAMPYASLDEIDFHRKDIGHAELEARVRFTLHLEGPPDAAVAGTAR